MKTIILFIAIFTLSVSAISCSDSANDTPNTTPDTVTFTVNGAQKNFTNVQVTESVFINEDQNIPTYNVLATYEEDNGEFVAFQVRRDYTGSDGLYTFIYNDSEGNHSIADNFNMDITSGTANRLAGTFSGPLFQQEIEPSVTITNGSFDIHY